MPRRLAEVAGVAIVTVSLTWVLGEVNPVTVNETEGGVTLAASPSVTLQMRIWLTPTGVVTAFGSAMAFLALRFLTCFVTLCL